MPSYFLYSLSFSPIYVVFVSIQTKTERSICFDSLIGIYQSKTKHPPIFADVLGYPVGMIISTYIFPTYNALESLPPEHYHNGRL